jgi:putative DNA primase/helicase
MTLTVKRWHEFRGEELKRPKSVVKPIIYRGSLGMCHGPRGAGKSWLAQELAYCVAAGKQFLHWDVAQPACVVYADGEMTDWERQRRFKCIEGPRLDRRAGARLLIITPNLIEGPTPDLETTDGQQQFERMLPADVALVVVDNLSAWCRSGREDAESWRGIQEWLMSLRARGIAVLLIHHTNKRGGQRGTSMREDALDYVISIRLPPNREPGKTEFDVYFEKIRHLPHSKVPPMHVRYKKVKSRPLRWIVTELEASSRSTRILKLHKAGFSNASIARKLKVHRSTVSRQLDQAKSTEKAH